MVLIAEIGSHKQRDCSPSGGGGSYFGGGEEIVAGISSITISKRRIWTYRIPHDYRYRSCSFTGKRVSSRLCRACTCSHTEFDSIPVTHILRHLQSVNVLARVELHGITLCGAGKTYRVTKLVAWKYMPSATDLELEHVSAPYLYAG